MFREVMKNFKEYLTIKEASEFLGVCKDTLRIWDIKGKLKSFRHPLNNYRLYKKSQLKKILNNIKTKRIFKKRAKNGKNKS